jgi:hypothetical protein
MNYSLVSLCIGNKYEAIREHFITRINEKCTNCDINIIDNTNDVNYSLYNTYAWWDIIRTKKIIEMLNYQNIPIVHCDIDIIIEKDISKLVNLNYDIIFSTEINGIDAFPKECSQKLGFGINTGFYIIKPTEKAIAFYKTIFNSMYNRKYNSYSDQETIMNYITSLNFSTKNEDIYIDNIKYTNKIITIDNIDICILDFNIIIRDPTCTSNQFANHINIDNVKGVDNFIKYYYDKIENLPSTCRNF